MFQHAIQTLEAQLETYITNFGITDNQKGLISSVEIIDDHKYAIALLKDAVECKTDLNAIDRKSVV